METANKIQKQIDKLYDELNNLESQHLLDSDEVVRVRAEIDELTAKFENEILSEHAGDTSDLLRPDYSARVRGV